jgi:hypothetical protein
MGTLASCFLYVFLYSQLTNTNNNMPDNMPDITPIAIAEPATIEFEGRTYIPLDKSLISPWVCLIGEHPIATLTLKDDDLFLITDTLGNISDLSCRLGGIEDSMGLFCRDTDF